MGHTRAPVESSMLLCVRVGVGGLVTFAQLPSYAIVSDSSLSLPGFKPWKSEIRAKRVFP